MSSSTTTSTTGSNIKELSFDNLKDAMKQLKNIDPLMRVAVSQLTWQNLPKRKKKKEILFPMGIPVDVSDIIPDNFIRKEYKSGKLSLLDLKTNKELVIVEGDKNAG